VRHIGPPLGRPQTPRRQRWLDRTGGTLAVAAVLLLPAAEHFVIRDRPPGPRGMLLLLPTSFAIWWVLERLLGPLVARLSGRLQGWGRWRREVARIAGVPVSIDAIAVAFVAAFLPSAMIWPPMAGAMVGSHFAIVLIHECGHALAVRRAKGHVVSIEISAFHGRTTYFGASDPHSAARVAWGGVLAQAVIALPACAWLVAQRTEMSVPLRLALLTLGPWSLLMAAVNLLPFAGLDGATAWRGLRRRPIARSAGGWKR